MPGNKKHLSDKFGEGEKVLCYHGPLLYEAKVTKIQLGKEKNVEYLIHYNGWSKSWDEWVGEDRILKINDATLQKQRDLLQQYPQAERQRKTGTSSLAGNKRKLDKKKELEAPLRKRRAARYDASDCSTRDSSPQRQEIQFEYPENIKKQLVDDWDLITRQKQLVNLPKKLTVSQILQQFHDHSVAQSNEIVKGQLTEVCSGLKDYFDVMLGTQLLYKFERPQYADILQTYSDKPSSEIFGIEHLLRLFVRLNSMLNYSIMDEDNLSLIQNYVQQLIKYLEDNLSTMTTDYDAAPAEYLRRQT